MWILLKNQKKVTKKWSVHRFFLKNTNGRIFINIHSVYKKMQNFGLGANSQKQFPDKV